MTRAGYVSKIIHSAPGDVIRDRIRARLRSAAGRKKLDVYDIPIVVIEGKDRPRILTVDFSELDDQERQGAAIHLIHVGYKWIERRLGRMLERAEIEIATAALLGNPTD